MTVAGAAKPHLGSWEQALAWFRRAIEANRNFPQAYFRLAAALAQLGRLDEARSAVQAGFALTPTFAASHARTAWTARSDDPTYVAQLEAIFDGLRKAGSPNNDRPPPHRGGAGILYRIGVNLSAVHGRNIFDDCQHRGAARGKSDRHRSLKAKTS
jgi:tetratricopeptide (TPR) repeat protein